MKLALHQFRLEFRRSWFGLFLFFLVLLCNYGVAAGWIARPSLTPEGNWGYGGMFATILALAYWIGFAMIVSSCVVSDSPARRDHFLATRPMPALSLIGGKFLYLLLAAILPTILLECLSAAAVGGDPAAIALAGLERFLLCTVTAIAIGAFAAHWKSVQGFLLASAIGFAAVIILGRLVISLAALIMGEERIGSNLEPTFLTALQGVTVLAAGLGLTAWIGSRRGQKYLYLIPALALCAAAGLFVMTASPLRALPYRPANQPKIDQLLENDAAVGLQTDGFYVSQLQDRPELSATYSLTPVVRGFPDDIEMRWLNLSSTWTIDGAPDRHRTANPQSLAQRYVSNDGVPISWALAHAVQNHLGTTVLFQTSPPGNWNHSSSLSPSSLDYRPDGQEAGKSAQVRTEVIGDAFRWQVVADLPLQPGTPHDEDTWHLAGTRVSDEGLHVQLTEQTVALQTAPELSLRRIPSRWRDRYKFLLYFPGDALAWFGTAGYERAVVSVSAAKCYFSQVDFGQMGRPGKQHRFGPEELAAARLIILQSDYLGRIQDAWESPKFILRSTPSSRQSVSRSVEDDDPLRAAEFALWFHRLEKISPEEERAVVHSHLRLLIQQFTETGRPPNSFREPAVIYLARFVPKHLEFLLTQFSELPYRPGETLIKAITIGALEEQRPAVIDAIMHDERLEPIAWSRGWSPDLHDQLVGKLENPWHRNPYQLQRLLSLGGPSNDELALDLYRVHPDPDVYATLCAIPPLAPRVDEITSDLWKPGRIVVDGDRPRGMLKFGLLQGRPEALDELFIILRFLGPDQSGYEWELAQLITTGIQVPKEVRVPKQVRPQESQNQRIIRWLLRHDPSEFTFDPVFRRFILKAANKTV